MSSRLAAKWAVHLISYIRKILSYLWCEWTPLITRLILHFYNLLFCWEQMMCQLGHSVVVNKEKSNTSYSKLPAVKREKKKSSSGSHAGTSPGNHTVMPCWLRVFHKDNLCTNMTFSWWQVSRVCCWSRNMMNTSYIRAFIMLKSLLICAFRWQVHSWMINKCSCLFAVVAVFYSWHIFSLRLSSLPCRFSEQCSLDAPWSPCSERQSYGRQCWCDDSLYVGPQLHHRPHLSGICLCSLCCHGMDVFMDWNFLSTWQTCKNIVERLH